MSLLFSGVEIPDEILNFLGMLAKTAPIIYDGNYFVSKTIAFYDQMLLLLNPLYLIFFVISQLMQVLLVA